MVMIVGNMRILHWKEEIPVWDFQLPVGQIIRMLAQIHLYTSQNLYQVERRQLMVV